MWVRPLQDKSGPAVRDALADWLRRLDRAPAKLKTDRGLEFRNQAVQDLLGSHGVRWEPADGTLKACIAERVNKTLQILIYKHLTEHETLRYIDVLFTDPNELGLNSTSILDTAPEFTLKLNGQPVSNFGVTVNGKPVAVEGSPNTYRYSFTGSLPDNGELVLSFEVDQAGRPTSLPLR